MKNQLNSNHNAGLYLRLSKDDISKDESISIETQRLILEKYCNDNNINIIEYYIDDGFTGSNFDRPDFNRMIEDIEKEKINCVLTKDLSRLGRDYIQTGTYIELYFTSQNVRFIAVDDGVDTDKPDTLNDLMIPIRNIFNEWHVRDLSKKVKNAKRRRMQEGMYISSQAAYGYRVNPDNPNQLMIDDEAADTVREIFKLALEGNGVVNIAKILTERQIIIPSYYKYIKGETRFAKNFENKPEDDKYTWRVSTVQSILGNIVYVGDMENLKHEKISYKNNIYRTVPKDERIIVQNTHEPIISREDFNTVQDLIKARSRNEIINDDHLFKGIIFCKHCGARMTIKTNESKKGKSLWYRCTKYRQYPDKCFKGNYIEYEELSKIVLDKIKEQINLLDKETVYKLFSEKVIDSARIERQKKEYSLLETRLRTLNNLVRKLYEDFSADLLTEDNYQKLLKDYQLEQVQIEKRLTDLNLQIDQSKDTDNADSFYKADIAELTKLTKLDKKKVNYLIERIEVGHKDKTASGNEREISLKFRFGQ